MSENKDLDENLLDSKQQKKKSVFYTFVIKYLCGCFSNNGQSNDEQTTETGGQQNQTDTPYKSILDPTSQLSFVNQGEEHNSRRITSCTESYESLQQSHNNNSTKSIIQDKVTQVYNQNIVTNNGQEHTQIVLNNNNHNLNNNENNNSSNNNTKTTITATTTSSVTQVYENNQIITMNEQTIIQQGQVDSFVNLTNNNNQNNTFSVNSNQTNTTAQQLTEAYENNLFTIIHEQLNTQLLIKA
ncbi:hypothetical protein TTHERM_00930620 (macronuclear) [Tetrahymena thermophila SB210]|uniref:Uncharacterized protein n=1 Tax=Tetrahymena thermophila (strain SB210) TaxID=312017 RepID=Q24CH9_TETTS|nr:hypothetical protein TTHERM_00930620 [Tetrahymena thermophila SB210]EAS05481.1 hypothetical protein TTHERM_00930620 [Tetrahymena thermophila SB210]|eukprot:XP_001025726.1 hypothetical protein TTHERM_00930620 [Tetrahymena thermophila SB210]